MKSFLSFRLGGVLVACLAVTACGGGDDSATGSTTPGGASSAGTGGSAEAGTGGSSGGGSAGTSGKGGSGGPSTGGSAGSGAAGPGGAGGAGQSQGGAGSAQGGAGMGGAGLGGEAGAGMAGSPQPGCPSDCKDSFKHCEACPDGSEVCAGGQCANGLQCVPGPLPACPSGMGGMGGNGGAGGASGTGGMSGAGGGQAVAQCKAGGDGCMLHSDCCRCLALGPGEEAPPCEVTECKASACELLGNPEVACSAGQCGLAVGCGAAEVMCKSVPPTCPAGSVPGVAAGCWTGQCIAVQECAHVSSCDPCTAAGLACVVDSVGSQFPIVHCVELPAACTEPTCGCLGPAVCVDGANLCTEQGSTITCECPNC